MSKKMGDALREKVLKGIYCLGMSTVKTYTRLGAYEPADDAEVYNMLNHAEDESKEK